MNTFKLGKINTLYHIFVHTCPLPGNICTYPVHAQSGNFLRNASRVLLDRSPAHWRFLSACKGLWASQITTRILSHSLPCRSSAIDAVSKAVSPFDTGLLSSAPSSSFMCVFFSSCLQQWMFSDWVSKYTSSTQTSSLTGFNHDWIPIFVKWM